MSFFTRFKWKYLLFVTFIVFIVDFFGGFTHMFEESFEESFRYPFYGDINTFVKQLRQKKSPSLPPINLYNYTFITNIANKCSMENVRLLIVVKSSASNFERRQAIRSTWGYERRFSDVAIRTIFVVGMVDDTDVLLSLIHEKEIYQDVLHVNFIDSYFNNTIKTMSAINWAVQYCPNSSYYYFSDDDMYVSVKNVLRFVRNPVEYPENLESLQGSHKWAYESDLPSHALLYAGHVFKSSPLRHKSSKWHVSLQEYPYDMWPPYVTAGSYILSREALHVMYYTSMYTKHFRFDDIFLALVAKKAGIEPFHSNEFYFYYKEYSIEGYKYAIAVHGYSYPSKLVKIWNEQKSAGNA